MCFKITKKEEENGGKKKSNDNIFMSALDVLPKDYKKIKIRSFTEQDCISEIRGPDKEEGLHVYKELISGQTISTYPHFAEHNQRDGDPICDHFAINVYDDRLIVGIADGCGWGSKPRAAATNGIKAFFQYVAKHLSALKTVKDGGTLILDAMNAAHIAIVAQKENLWEVGTTTMLAGLLFPIQDEALGTHGLLFSSVGDSKAFYYSHKDKATTDLSRGNRPNFSDPTDCGGRIGPQLDGGKPDLRNLTILFQPCSENDMFLIVSDGIHDNLDPQYLGKSPTEINLTKEKWEDIDPVEAEEARDSYRQNFVTKFIEQNNFEPQAIVADILNFCQKTTQSSRDFMISNYGKKLPADYVLYPGKMDHTTVVIFKVGVYK